jgi:hypothetical protein
MEEYGWLTFIHSLAEGTSSPLFDWPVGMACAAGKMLPVHAAAKTGA